MTNYKLISGFLAELVGIAIVVFVVRWMDVFIFGDSPFSLRVTIILFGVVFALYLFKRLFREEAK